MGFVRVTAPDKALELYNAGLLWEEWIGDSGTAARIAVGLDKHAAYGWDESCLLEKCTDSDTNWRFYLYLED